MAIKLKGLEATLSTFREVDRRFKEVAAIELENGAKEMSALARSFAPVDQGDLERTIRAERVRGGGAYKWRVRVGGMSGGRDTAIYALAAHEGRSTNMRSWSLGPKSRDKAQRLGVQVGPGYLFRAFRQLSPVIQARITKALRGEASSLSRKLK